MKVIKCDLCEGHYKVCSGKYGDFAGCSNFPKCKSTKKLYELVLDFVKKYGISIYKWERICWSCGEVTPVYTYYLSCELQEIDEYFGQNFAIVGLGDIKYIDKILEKKYKFIQKKFSNTMETSYTANTCVNCRALQGKNYVVDDPHKIIGDLWREKAYLSMEKYKVETVAVDDVKSMIEDIKNIYFTSN